MARNNGILEPTARDFYRTTIRALTEAKISFPIGGAHALTHYTGIRRDTKDLDVFVRRDDCRPALALFARRGHRAELTFPHWLGKVYSDEYFVDVIFSSGNGLAEVDDEWFACAHAGTALGEPVQFCPVEEIIWSKAFVMERERYDGADIAHLLRARAEVLDWARLLRRFGSHWRLLLCYLVLFGFSYPDERQRIPQAVMDELCGRLRTEQLQPGPATGFTQGTLLSREQFLIDISQWGYRDARLQPHGKMSSADVARWTEAIDEEEPTPSQLTSSEAS